MGTPHPRCKTTGRQGTAFFGTVVFRKLRTFSFIFIKEEKRGPEKAKLKFIDSVFKDYEHFKKIVDEN